MPRCCCCSSLAGWLRAGALAAALALAGGDACVCAANAQPASDGEASLLAPALDGNPQPPPRFRARQKKEERDHTRFGQLPSFGNAPGSGAGLTGFDSTNRVPRIASSATNSESWSGIKSPTKPENRPGAKPGARPGTKPGTKPESKPGTGAQTKATGNAAGKPKQLTKPVGANGGGAQAGGGGAGVKADLVQGGAGGADAASPRLLQPAVAPLAGRLRQFRPGAPPASPDAEIATVATTPPLWRPIPDPKPFDPLGVQVGAFNFRPAIEYLRGYDTNPARLGLPPISASWFNFYAPELLVNSNWSRHELTANVRGAFTSFDTAHRLDRPMADGRINGRVDVTSHTRVDLEGRFILGTDYPGSPNIQADLARLPIYTTLGGSAGIGQRFNRFEVTFKGGVDRTEFQKSVFINGQTENNNDRDYNQYSTALRAAYELSPGVRPFAEVTANQRVHDLPVDRFGLDRNSAGYSAKAGSSFDLARMLTGEIAMGYVNQMYLAPLPNLGGVLVEGSLLWSASALTTAKLFATTTITESPLLLVSGVFSRQVVTEVNHAFRRFLIGTAKFGIARDEYAGALRKDNRFMASAALTYLFTRELGLKGEMRQEWQRSNIPGASYVASIWLLGLRLQR